MEGWAQTRLQVLERDNHICQVCLNSVCSLEIHHKISRKKGGSDNLDNLITLCRKCHKTMEPPHIGGIKYVTKTLRVSDETHNELIKLGKYGESMDDIIQGIIKKVKNVK